MTACPNCPGYDDLRCCMAERKPDTLFAELAAERAQRMANQPTENRAERRRRKAIARKITG